MQDAVSSPVTSMPTMLGWIPIKQSDSYPGPYPDESIDCKVLQEPIKQCDSSYVPCLDESIDSNTLPEKERMTNKIEARVVSATWYSPTSTFDWDFIVLLEWRPSASGGAGRQIQWVLYQGMNPTRTAPPIWYEPWTMHPLVFLWRPGRLELVRAH